MHHGQPSLWPLLPVCSLAAMSSVIAIIPAQGACEALTRSTVRPLAGRPLLQRAVEAALGARHVHRVLVTTNDPEIASLARSFGAGVIKSPAELASTAPSESALLHALEYLALSENYHPDLLVVLEWRSPLTTSEEIDGVVQLIFEEEADTALSVARFFHFVWREGPEGAEGVNHAKLAPEHRQDQERQFLETGAIYAMRVAGFLGARHRFFGKTVLYEASSPACQIGGPGGTELAELLLRRREERDRLALLPTRPTALVLDFDGVLSDNRVWTDTEGRELVACDRGDGWGLGMLRRRGFPVVVLSTEINPVVAARCRKLELEYQHGLEDKLAALDCWLQERQLSRESVIYVGNDLNDLACLVAVGCGVAVGDAHPGAKQAARLLLSAPGGRGAVREITDLILAKLEEAAGA